jgi:hypothetical protein
MPKDLTEASLLELREQLRAGSMCIKPTQVFVTPEGWENAVAKARSDPDYAKLVLDQLGIDLLAA